MRAPNCCPMCGESHGWILIDITKKGFNAKKAIIGGVFLGYVGLAAGAFGNKKSLYICKKCNFQHEYDGEAAKNVPIEQAMKADDFKDGGINKVWIDIIIKATPDCQFCGKSQRLFVKYNFNSGDYSFRCGHCLAEFKCDFSFGGKVKEKSVNIINCGDINKNEYQTGVCNATLLIKDTLMIK